MGVDFRWEAGGSEDGLPVLEPARRRRREWRRVLIPLAVVLVLGGVVAWRVGDGERAAREDLQRVVEQEIAALKAGRPEVLSALLSGSPLYWRRYHEASFYRESAWYAARGAASVRVEQVRLEPGGAVATVALDDGRRTRRGTWHYVRVGDAWRHAPPPADYWAETQTVEAPHITVRAARPDLDLAQDLAGELEAFYAGLLEAYSVSPELPGRPVPSAVLVPSQVSIEVTPSVVGAEWSTHVPDNGEAVLNVRLASPQLGLELWTVEEQRAHLNRAARTAVAQQVVYGAMWGVNGEPPWAVVQGLIFWQAGAWEPEWDRYLQVSLADGTAEGFLSILDGDLEAERFFDDVSAGAGSPEEAMLRLLPLTYCLGELLGTRYPAEELLPFLHNAGRHDTIWGAFEAELRLSRAELEEAWRAHLRQRAGVGVTNP